MKREEITKPITIVKYNLQKQGEKHGLLFEDTEREAFISFYVSEEKYKEIREEDPLDEYSSNVEIRLSDITREFVQKRLGKHKNIEIISFDDMPNFTFEQNQDNGHFIKIEMRINDD